jgi:crotonobetainyl-CoA:carnitine CoA-transferase CaiB-like acyl-CoA transferase
MALIGVGDDPRFATFEGRIAHRDEVDDLLAQWIATRDEIDVLIAFENAEAAIAPVLDMAAIAHDPHYEARNAIVEIEGVPMQALIARLSATPGHIRWAGRAIDADGEAIRAELEHRKP